MSSHTVKEAMLLKANQKRSLVIQKGEPDWRSLFGDETVPNKLLDEMALTKAPGEVEDTEDARTVAMATKAVVRMEGASEADFGGDGDDVESGVRRCLDPKDDAMVPAVDGVAEDAEPEDEGGERDDDDGGIIVDSNGRYTSPRRRHILGLIDAIRAYSWAGRSIGRLQKGRGAQTSS